MNWSLTSIPTKDEKHPATIGPREQVKATLQGRVDIPQQVRDALCARIDAIPATVTAIKLDAAETTHDRGKIIGHYTINPLY